MSDPASKDLYSFLKDKGLTSQQNTATSDASPNGDAQRTRDVETGPKPFLDFDEDGVGEKLHQASTEQLNKVNFGVVRIDDEGVVQFYNRYESELAGVDPKEAQGRNFFTQLAPCSNNRIFLGRFKKGVHAGELDERFTYTFTYKMRPTLVDIRLYRDSQNNNWVMVRKR